MAHRSEVFNNVLRSEERIKGSLIARSGAQADYMEIFEQDTELACSDTGTVAPADQTKRRAGGIAKREPTHFFIISRSVLSKSKGPAAGTESVSDDIAFRAGSRRASEMCVSVRRSWSTPSLSKYPTVTREPAPRPGTRCGIEGDGSLDGGFSGATGNESTLGLFFVTLCISPDMALVRMDREPRC